MTPLDIYTIDPGVRRLVALLREHGHETTDSGDGRSKPPEERTMGDTAHAHILPRAHEPVLADVASAAHEASAIVRLLRERGVQVLPGTVQLTWDPVAPTPMITVLGVTDEHLQENA